MTALVPLLILTAAAIAAALIFLLKPLLQRYALARPNARSSHRIPTPQGGGIAVLGATLLAVAIVSPAGLRDVAIPAAAALLLAVVGAWDDLRPLPALPRLLLQFLAVGAVVLGAMAPEARLLPEAWAPLWLERGLVILAGVWFVNLVNFMDGLDWITVAGFVPMLTLLALFGAITDPSGPTLLAAALLGGLLGFAPFNKPVARLFLGDVGSLPIGLLAGYLLYRLALAGAPAAALLLPLYHVADATLTLLRRIARGERIWEAHRTHYYQRATDNGFTVMQVSGTVFVLNLLLAGLAAATLFWPAPLDQGTALAVGACLVGATLWRFAHSRSET